jgi:hypothetical protein
MVIKKKTKQQIMPMMKPGAMAATNTSIVVGCNRIGTSATSCLAAGSDFLVLRFALRRDMVL